MPNQLSYENLSINHLNKLSKKLNIQILHEMIFLEILSKKTKKNLLKISNYDNFEHVSELIKEEIEEIKIEEKIFENKNFFKKNKFLPFDSVYRNYYWVFCSFKNFYFLSFFKKSKSIIQIQRNFIKLDEFFENLNFSKNFQIEKKNLLKKFFDGIINKNRIIKKLEENFENEQNLSNIKIVHEKVLEIPLDIEDEFNYFLQKDEKKIFLNKKIFKILAFIFVVLSIILMCYFYGVLFSKRIIVDNEIEVVDSLPDLDLENIRKIHV